MWELDYKESWVPKKWCFWTVVLKKTLESPLDCKEIQPVHPKGDQSWVFIGRTDVEAETPILWLHDTKSWLIWKYPDAGKDWGQEENGTTEDEMAGWHHQLDRREFEWTPGVGDGQGGLACCNSWGRKESETTELLNWNELWFRASLVAQMVKRLPTMQETQVQSLGQVDPLEKEMTPHSNTLAWKIPRMEEPGRLQSVGLKRVRYGWITSLSLSFFHTTIYSVLGIMSNIKII